MALEQARSAALKLKDSSKLFGSQEGSRQKVGLSTKK